MERTRLIPNEGSPADGEIFLRLEHREPPHAERGELAFDRFGIFCARTGERLGEILLREGEGEAAYYGGHVSYSILPRHRGHRYAASACLLLGEIARRRGIRRLYIACTPGNKASRRTCELAGARLVEIADIPEHLPLYQNGRRKSCVYEMVL